MHEFEVEEYNLQSREKLRELIISMELLLPQTSHKFTVNFILFYLPVSYASFMFLLSRHLLREVVSDIPGWIGSFRPLFCNTPVM